MRRLLLPASGQKKKNKTKANRNRNAPNLFLMVGTFINQLHGDDKPKKKNNIENEKNSRQTETGRQMALQICLCKRVAGVWGKWEVGTGNSERNTENWKLRTGRRQFDRVKICAADVYVNFFHHTKVNRKVIIITKTQRWKKAANKNVTIKFCIKN